MKRERVATDRLNDADIISAFREKGWNLYRTNQSFDNLNDIISFGPAKELFYHEEDRTHYFILPIVNNPRAPSEIENKLQELYEKDSLPRLQGVIHESPFAGIAFGRETVTLVENTNGKAHEVKYSDILRIIRNRLNKI